MHDDVKQKRTKRNLLQYAVRVDYESKMIVSVDINNKPTDHNQLEKQIEKVEETIQETYKVISADNGYHTNENINSIENKYIDLQ